MNPSINKWAGFSKRQLAHRLPMEKRRLGYRETEKWRAKKKKKKDSLLLSTASDGAQTVQTRKSGVMALH